MKKSFCDLLDYYPRESEVEKFYSTNIANSVFNSFLSYTAIMLNIATIHAVRKTSSLPKTLKTLLLSLAVSDVGVGLLVQPFYASFFIKWLHENNPGCSTHSAFYFVGHIFSSASFFGVMAVSVDRFLAIHLHLRYQELVTHKRVLAVVISIWVLSVFDSFSMFWVSRYIYSLIIAIIGIIGLILTTMVYIRIYLAVRRHKNQIQVQHVQQIAQTSLINSAIGIFYVYLVFLFCCLPYFVSLAAFKIYGPNVTLKKVFLFSLTLLYLNSSLNPVIYCWKMRHIRHAVINILRNMSRHRSRTAHETLSLAGHTMPWFNVNVVVRKGDSFQLSIIQSKPLCLKEDLSKKSFCEILINYYPRKLHCWRTIGLPPLTLRESVCEQLLQYFHRLSDHEDFYSMYITNVAINSFLSYTAIMLNNAIRRRSPFNSCH